MRVHQMKVETKRILACFSFADSKVMGLKPWGYKD